MSKLLGEKIRDQAVLQWVADKGDETLSVIHDGLDQNSLVIDVGGYKGEWAQKIYFSYKCFIEIYEPHHQFVLDIKNRFINEIGKKITVKEFALGYEDTYADLLIDGLATSVKKGDKAGEIPVISASSVFYNRNIDLLKMNIEGSEYEVFESIFENKLIKNINSILVQFHPIDNNSIDKYKSIIERLSQTHKCLFRYPFIWEKWIKISE